MTDTIETRARAEAEKLYGYTIRDGKYITMRVPAFTDGALWGYEQGKAEIERLTAENERLRAVMGDNDSCVCGSRRQEDDYGECPDCHKPLDGDTP